MEIRGEQDLCDLGHQGRLEEGASELGKISIGNRRLGRANQAEEKARAKAPEDWKHKSRHKESWVVFIIKEKNNNES